MGREKKEEEATVGDTFGWCRDVRREAEEREHDDRPSSVGTNAAAELKHNRAVKMLILLCWVFGDMVSL